VTIRIYTDGSILDNTKAGPDTPAAWAFVVVEGGEIVHRASGLVITDDWHKDYIGASIGSNNTAELSAIAQAGIYCRLRNLKDVVILTDSKYAKEAIQGAFQPQKNITLILFTRQVVYVHDSIKLKWVKGHAGDEFNEEADRLARSVLVEQG
jgi:ribonuclease HI